MSPRSYDQWLESVYEQEDTDAYYEWCERMDIDPEAKTSERRWEEYIERQYEAPE